MENYNDFAIPSDEILDKMANAYEKNSGLKKQVQLFKMRESFSDYNEVVSLFRGAITKITKFEKQNNEIKNIKEKLMKDLLIFDRFMGGKDYIINDKNGSVAQNLSNIIRLLLPLINNDDIKLILIDLIEILGIIGKF